VTCCV